MTEAISEELKKILLNKEYAKILSAKKLHDGSTTFYFPKKPADLEKLREAKSKLEILESSKTDNNNFLKLSLGILEIRDDREENEEKIDTLNHLLENLKIYKTEITQGNDRVKIVSQAKKEIKEDAGSELSEPQEGLFKKIKKEHIPEQIGKLIDQIQEIKDKKVESNSRNESIFASIYVKKANLEAELSSKKEKILEEIHKLPEANKNALLNKYRPLNEEIGVNKLLSDFKQGEAEDIKSLKDDDKKGLKILLNQAQILSNHYKHATNAKSVFDKLYGDYDLVKIAARKDGIYKKIEDTQEEIDRLSTYNTYKLDIKTNIITRDETKDLAFSKKVECKKHLEEAAREYVNEVYKNFKALDEATKEPKNEDKESLEEAAKVYTEAVEHWRAACDTYDAYDATLTTQNTTKEEEGTKNFAAILNYEGGADKLKQDLEAYSLKEKIDKILEKRENADEHKISLNNCIITRAGKSADRVYSYEYSDISTGAKIKINLNNTDATKLKELNKLISEFILKDQTEEEKRKLLALYSINNTAGSMDDMFHINLNKIETKEAEIITINRKDNTITRKNGDVGIELLNEINDKLVNDLSSYLGGLELKATLDESKNNKTPEQSILHHATIINRTSTEPVGIYRGIGADLDRGDDKKLKVTSVFSKDVSRFYTKKQIDGNWSKKDHVLPEKSTITHINGKNVKKLTMHEIKTELGKNEEVSLKYELDGKKETLYCDNANDRTALFAKSTKDGWKNITKLTNEEKSAAVKKTLEKSNEIIDLKELGIKVKEVKKMGDIVELQIIEVYNPTSSLIGTKKQFTGKVSSFKEGNFISQILQGDTYKQLNTQDTKSPEKLEDFFSKNGNKFIIRNYEDTATTKWEVSSRGVNNHNKQDSPSAYLKKPLIGIRFSKLLGRVGSNELQ